MEKLINDVADVRAGQAFLKQSVERMEDKLDKALEEHEDRIRALETYERQAARPYEPSCTSRWDFDLVV